MKNLPARRVSSNPTVVRPMGALTPSLPQALRSALASGIISVDLPGPGYGIEQHERRDWDPPRIDAHTLEVALIALGKLPEHLEAIDEAALSTKISVFLSHRWRWQSDRPINPQFEEMRQLNWVEDLCSYPEWAIDNTLRIWRRSHPEYPTIAEIVALCEAEVADDRRTWRLLHKLIEAQNKEAA